MKNGEGTKAKSLLPTPLPSFCFRCFSRCSPTTERLEQAIVFFALELNRSPRIQLRSRAFQPSTDYPEENILHEDYRIFSIKRREPNKHWVSKVEL